MTEPTNIEESEHMPVTPDCSYIIVGLAGEHPEWLEENTRDTILKFMMEAGARLQAIDPHWGYLTRSGPKSLTLPNNQTIDSGSFLYDSTMQVVDVLRDQLERPKKAQPHWLLVPSIDPHWYPIAGGEMDSSSESA